MGSPGVDATMPGAAPRDTARPRRDPAWVLVLALLVAALHLLPTWRAQLAVADGWRFTGNLAAVSPDAMQYSVWYRQPVTAWGLGSNVLTPEPNPPHLPLLWFAGVGRLAETIGVAPELVASYLGAALAALLVVLVYRTLRDVCPASVDQRWVLPLTLLGGGLGAYLLRAADTPALREYTLLRTLVLIPAREWPLWDVFRGNYCLQALLEPHSAFQWVLVLLSVRAIRSAILARGAAPVVAAAALCAVTTVFHFYMGITLAGIAAGVGLLCRLRGDEARRATLVSGVVLAALAITLALLLAVFRRGGLPMSPWRGGPVLVSVLLIAYPVAWVGIAWGARRLFRDAGFERTFLLGWAAGCLAVMLAGPFYPYPDRGSVTLQIALTALAATLWFEVRPRVPWALGVAVILVSVASPVRLVRDLWGRAEFRDGAPAVFLDAARAAAADALRAASHPDDLLLARESDMRWLAPAHRGRSYCAHFFMTVDHDTRSANVEAFWSKPRDERAKFLVEQGITLVWVAAADDPSRARWTPGFHAVHEGSAGTIFRVGPEAGAALVR